MEGYVTTPQQKRLLHFQQDNRSLRSLALIALEGHLQVPQLKKSLELLIANHEILRTQLLLPHLRKEHVQIISEEVTFAWKEIQQTDPVADAWLSNLLEQENAAPISKADEQNIHVTLYHKADGAYYLLINLPAFLADGWSLGLFHEALGRVYGDLCSGQLEYVEDGIQYTQYGDWLQELEEEAEGGTAYWNRQNGRAANPPGLPEDKADATQNFCAARYRLKDTQTLTAHRASAQPAGATLERYLLACWTVCLARISGSSFMDLAVADHARCFEELEVGFGPFARFLPLHLQWPNSATLAQIVGLLEESNAESEEWRDYYELQRSYADQSCPYVFEFETVPAAFQAGPVSFRCGDRFHAESPFLLKLNVSQEGEGLLLDFYYDKSRLFSRTVARWATYFQNLVQAGLACPDLPAARLVMLADAERKELLNDWNDNATVTCPDLVCALFGAQVLATPEKTAVAFSARDSQLERLSFADLNSRANRLAHFLRARGIGADTVVPLCFQRSTTLMTAILGVLKSGAAYLVLEPNFPCKRLRDMIEQIGADLALVGKDTGDLGHVETVCLTSAHSEFADYSDANPSVPISAAQAAYVLFTSGSSGKPKAVMISHGNLANYVAGVTARLRFPQAGNFALVSTPAADLGNTMIYPSLCHGGCLHIFCEELIGDPNALADSFRQNHIDCLKITPTHLSALLQANDPPAVLPAQCLVLGGEASRWEMVHQIAALRPNLNIFNHYGPTETTVGVLTHAFSGVRHEAQTLPLGKPIANTSIYLLNSFMEPSPTGTPAELYIGGQNVTRGYHREPAMTALRFLPDPYSATAGARMYRSGDQARYLADGSLEFLGRVDRQVKVRGYRVELAEIEAALEAQADISEAAILFRDLPHQAGQQALVAYLVLKGESFHEKQLREDLHQSLPDYMIPWAFIVLETMPLTANGKLDLRALNELPISMPKTAKMKPANPVEEILATVWAEVLGLDQVSTTATIFELGGHSLMLIMLNTRTEALLQVNLGIRQLFKNPTIAQIAEAIFENEEQPGRALRLARALIDLMALPREEKLRRLAEKGLTPAAGEQGEITYLDLNHLFNSGAPLIRRREPQDPKPIPLSFAQQRLWFVDQAEGENSTYNNPTAIRFFEPMDLPVLGRCFSEVERRHEMLRTAYRLQDGSPIQVIHEPRSFQIEAVDLSHLDPAQREARLIALMEEEARKPFDLESGPVWRVNVFKMGENDHALVVTLHHICSDAWSMDIFARELGALYTAFSQGLPSPLPELAIQYGDYATWQREWLVGDALESELDYWREKLANVRREPSLPYDMPRPRNLSSKGATQKIELDQSLSEVLRKLSQERESTLYITLLTGFYILLYSYDKQEDQVVGADVANRAQGQTSDLIGFFINQLALRTRLAVEESIEDLLVRVRQTALEAYEHQEVPFDKVINAFPVDRGSNVPPLFQAKLFLGQSRAGGAGATNAESLQVNTASARLDLTMGMWDPPDSHITGWLNYNTELFLAETIAGMVSRFKRICSGIALNPRVTLSELVNTVLKEEAAQIKQEGQQMAKESASKFARGRRKRVKKVELVEIRPPEGGRQLPAIVLPKSDNTDLPQWLNANKSIWEEHLYKHGALLFRGFHFDNPDKFRDLAGSLIDVVFKENAEHQIVTEDGAVQTPVDYAADQHLLWHNENSYNYLWPQKILFACAIPASGGGETPIVDSRQMMRELPEHIVEPFVRKGIRYVRNYSKYLGLDWRQIFKTEDPAVVEQRCREDHMAFEWCEGDQLRTFATRPAVWRHAKTGEMSWFNQAQHWHFSCLDQNTRKGLAALYHERDYPRNCYYGDGSRIEDEVLQIILDTYRRLEVSSPWLQGDAVLLDNLLAAHARNPYQGERKILVSMGDVLTYSGWKQGEE